MSDFSIKDQIESLKPDELIKLIMYLIQSGDQTRLLVLEWLDKNSYRPQNAVNQ
ncbi:MAG: hypothetical protein AB7V48_01865 [Sedimentibacter sp.]